MTLLPAAVILVARSADGQSRRTVFTYLSVTHLGGAGTWIAVLLLAQAGAIGGSSAIEQGSGLQIAIALAALIGMGTKAGLMPLHVWLPRAHPMAPGAGVGADERRDDQGRDLRPRARARRLGRGRAGVVRRARARPRRALGRRGRHVRALPARPQAPARAALDREHRDHRARPRRLPRPASPRRRHLGGVRARGRAAAHAEPRDLQGAALPRRGRVRARGRLARARPPRRPAAAHAVDRRRVPRRGDGDRRAAAAERLRLGVADAPGAAARHGVRRASPTGPPARSRSPRSPRPPRSPSSASSRSSVSCSSGRRGGMGRRPPTESPLRDARGRRLPRARLRRARARPGRALPPAGRARAVARDGSGRGRPRPARNRIAADGRDRGRARRDHGAAREPAQPAERRARTELGVRPGARRRASAGRAPASRSRSGSCSR